MKRKTGVWAAALVWLGASGCATMGGVQPSGAAVPCGVWLAAEAGWGLTDAAVRQRLASERAMVCTPPAPTQPAPPALQCVPTPPPAPAQPTEAPTEAPAAKDDDTMRTAPKNEANTAFR